MDRKDQPASGPRAQRGKTFAHWGDNVVVADFGARRREESVSKHGRKGSSSTLAAAEAESWAAARLMECVTSNVDTNRLGRGREYFRAGRVLEVDMDTNLISAVVSGSQLAPFDVQIRARKLRESRRAFIRESVFEDGNILRTMLERHAPPLDIAAMLFPSGSIELIRCSCPDPAPVCKHAIAVTYRAASIFNDDPLRIFRWRGIDISDAIGAARKGWMARVGERPDGLTHDTEGRRNAEAEVTVDPEKFWGDPGTSVTWERFPIEDGLHTGDEQALKDAIRSVTWTSVDQLRVLDELEQCVEMLYSSERMFDIEPWVNRK